MKESAKIVIFQDICWVFCLSIAFSGIDSLIGYKTKSVTLFITFKPLLTSIKQQLHSRCLAYIHERIMAAQEAIRVAQQSANEETKSSAGDKYETGRAMAQLEIEKNSVQLAESLKLKQVLEQIQPDSETETVRLGSAVFTNQGNFYIAISAGQFTINDKIYYVISPASPIGQKLMGLQTQKSFLFNKKAYKVLQVI